MSFRYVRKQRNANRNEKKPTYRRCDSGEKNTFGTVGCFWHLKGGGVLNSCPMGLIRFSSVSSFDVPAYIMKHGMAWKINKTDSVCDN